MTLRCSAPWVSAGTDARFLCGEDSGTLRRGFPALAGAFRLEKEAVMLLGTADVPALLDIARAQRSAGKDKGVVGAARAGRKVFCRHAGERAPSRAVERVCRALLPRAGQRKPLPERRRGRLPGSAAGPHQPSAVDAAGARAHILACCAHQYAEGDVQHWYHPTGGETAKGVRTDCSDDLLWLPWAVCEYVRMTADESLCAETAPYLTSPPLARGEHSRYETPSLSGETGTVLDHCHRAAALVLRRGIGEHRLLRMGGGDWNDGFDAMGEERGERVAHVVCLRCVPRFFRSAHETWRIGRGSLRDRRGRARRGGERGVGHRSLSARVLCRRGTPLGASGAAACRIDSVAQSFAAFSPYADRDRVQTALTAALAGLRDRERRLIRIYAPAFLPEERAPGYVSTYGPGFRENGGQYTHAAVWARAGAASRRRREEAAALAEDMALSLAAPEYGAEPFVLPADIAYAPGKEGRAGWSWYTGAAGWYLRLLRELYGTEP